MIDVDERFRSLDEWTSFLGQHPALCDPATVGAGVKRILQAGFTEPLTGRRVTPPEIAGTEGNWREGLSANGLNSRMRAVLAVLDEEMQGRSPTMVRIFAAEAVTAFALLLRARYPRFIGSEYGLDEAARDALYPIMHQDLTALSLPSDSFDVVTTNEVLEHVPDLDAALREIARVLRPGGVHIGTHPFQYMLPNGDVRARLVNGALTHLKEPEYHGNPVDPAGGSLVFETPGWDLIARARAAGLGDAYMRFVASEAQGYVTSDITGVFVFCARKVSASDVPAVEDGGALHDARAALHEARAEAALARAEADMQRSRVLAIEQSTSWRLTGPLRRVVRLLRGST